MMRGTSCSSNIYQPLLMRVIMRVILHCAVMRRDWMRVSKPKHVRLRSASYATRCLGTGTTGVRNVVYASILLQPGWS